VRLAVVFAVRETNIEDIQRKFKRYFLSTSNDLRLSCGIFVIFVLHLYMYFTYFMFRETDKYDFRRWENSPGSSWLTCTQHYLPWVAAYIHLYR